MTSILEAPTRRVVGLAQLQACVDDLNSDQEGMSTMCLWLRIFPYHTRIHIIELALGLRVTGSLLP